MCAGVYTIGVGRDKPRQAEKETEMLEKFEAIKNDPRRKDLVKVRPAVRDASGRIVGCQGLAI